MIKPLDYIIWLFKELYLKYTIFNVIGFSLLQLTGKINKHSIKNKSNSWDSWVALSIDCPSVHLSSGLNFWVLSSSPVLGSALGVELTLK